MLEDRETAPRISAIVPTYGRAQSLRRLLESLATQTLGVFEIVIADGGGDAETRAVAEDPLWRARGLAIRFLAVSPPNAVRQRRAAIDASQGALLLLLDDDVALEKDCVAELAHALASRADSVGVMANMSNDGWPPPTRVWRFVLRRLLGFGEGEWQGRVIGPLLRYGFSPAPADIAESEWIGGATAMIRRSAYVATGGFSDFFLHRCTMSEDVDLSLKLRRFGALYFAPRARIAHFHAADGRVSARIAAEDDIFNRYMILRRTLGRSRAHALSLIVAYAILESLGSTLRLLGAAGPLSREILRGRAKGLARIVAGWAER
ncbi:GT2 family glycosyltransferase [Methylosinus sp. sav-2]|uniref:glycosyltransferase family 2 protein n=1 Tax=Methylosinus sp. sav-2 TaxID=2485168 RepID=UPI0004791BD7|nr:glycosyltransferase [Methylosinus sp. sav-2]TDX63941.1 GT2 family glycosyltransferase [Methylosinus sp. sav-2]